MNSRTLGITGKITVDVSLCLGIRDADVLGKSEGGDAVDDAEVDGLCLAPHLGRDLVGRQAEDLRRGAGVDVLVLDEGLDEARSPLMWARMRSSICE